MLLCVGVCRHVLAGCFFVSIYVDMCRQSFCVSAVGHPKNIQKVKVRKSLKKGCNGQPTEMGNKGILTIIESFSGHIRLYSIPDQTAQTIAERLTSYIAIHSMPLKIIMDKLSGCRETAYEGKTTAVGAKKQKEQKKQKRKQEEQKCKRKAKEIKRKAKEMLLQSQKQQKEEENCMHWT